MLTTHHQRSTPWNRRRAFSRAFSLVELVMVLVIAGVIAAIAVPRMSGSIGRQRALAAARRVAADLETARTAAMAGSASRKVVFSPARSAYGTPGMTGTLDQRSTIYLVDLTRPPYNASLAAANFNDSASLKWAGVYDSDAAQEVVFDGFGRPDSTGWVFVSSGGVYYKVTLDATGRTQVAVASREEVNVDISGSASVAVGDFR
jgi:prepilin-type N-terminal cleavage/methylation domain-containing protein